MEKFIAVTADFCILFPVIILFSRKVYVYSLLDKMISIFVLLLFFRNLASYITMELNIYNIFIYNWSSLLTSGLIGLIYNQTLVGKDFKKIAIVSIFISIGVSLIDYTTLFDIKNTHFNRFSFNISGCCAVLLVLLHFYELVQYLRIETLKTYPLFWFSSGVLFYYSGTVFTYLFISTTLNNLPNREIYWMIDAFLFIIFSLFLSLTIWYMKPHDLKK